MTKTSHFIKYLSFMEYRGEKIKRIFIKEGGGTKLTSIRPIQSLKQGQKITNNDIITKTMSIKSTPIENIATKLQHFVK